MTAPAAAQPPGAHLPSALQLALSGLAVASLAGTSLALLFLAIVQALEPSAGPELAVSTLLNAAGLFLAALLVAPSAVFALLRLLGRRVAPPAEGSLWHRLYRPGLWLLLLPVVLGLGYAASLVPWAALLVLPPLHLLGMSLPVFWLAWLARRRLVNEAPQRFWGVLAASLTLGPLLILILEIAALAALVAAATFYVLSNPGLMRHVLALSQAAERGRVLDPQQSLDLLAPFFADGGLVFLLFLALTVVTPLIEEALKPIGVWLLAGRRLTGAEGFAAGALSGAGFALFENVTRGVPAEGWAFLVTARAGTALLHVLTSGLVGYALALAWREGRWLRLAAAYLAAVALHGLWNGAVIAVSLVALQAETGIQLPLPAFWLVIGAGLVLILSIGFLAILLAGNRRLQALPGRGRRAAPGAPSPQEE
ncbi:MAG: PrsW family intramembrane metalloprotease [Chloroflexi bacterium]|nr:PrsW family intramembrane metalloprotease [Chloroflexota bacterium]